MTNLAAIEQINLFHGDSEGYVTMFRKFSNGSTRQFHYKADELTEHIAEWGSEDVYLSMNTYYVPKRATHNLQQLRSLYVDLDTYSTEFTNEQVLMHLESDYYNKIIPRPNAIIHSGRGLCLVYLLEPVPYKKAIGRWQWVENELVNKLQQFGSDSNCKDPARVLRLAGTKNSKNGETVYIDYLHTYRYDLEEIKTEYAPIPRRVKKEKRKYTKSTSKHKKFTLQRARCADIETLVQLRHGQCTGIREYLLYNYRYNMSFFAPGEALKRTMELNSMFSEPLQHGEVISATQNVYAAYQQSMIDRKPVYKLKNETFIDRVSMTKSEMVHMKTFIDSEEADKRKQDRRKGRRTWSAYLAYLQERKQDAAKKLYAFFCSNPKATNKDAAAFIGKSISTVKRLKALFPVFIAQSLKRAINTGSPHNTRKGFEPPRISHIPDVVSVWGKPLLE